MNTITIKRLTGTTSFEVFVDGRTAGPLTWDEMLGQVVGLTHPLLGKPHYRMLTKKEWRSEERANAKRAAADRKTAK